MSKASGYDLTDFFEKWGFLSPINTIVYSYSTEPLVVTQARIDEVKARVKALGLPKPPVPLEYITDKTVEIVKRGQAVVKGGNASWSGVDLRISDWQNVMVYEIWDKPYGTAGARLLYVCDGYDAKKTNSTNAKLAVARNYLDRFISNTESFHPYAVGVDNSRTEIPIN